MKDRAEIEREFIEQMTKNAQGANYFNEVATPGCRPDQIRDSDLADVQKDNK